MSSVPYKASLDKIEKAVITLSTFLSSYLDTISDFYKKSFPNNDLDQWKTILAAREYSQKRPEDVYSALTTFQNTLEIILNSEIFKPSFLEQYIAEKRDTSAASHVRKIHSDVIAMINEYRENANTYLKIIASMILDDPDFNITRAKDLFFAGNYELAYNILRAKWANTEEYRQVLADIQEYITKPCDPIIISDLEHFSPDYSSLVPVTEFSTDVQGDGLVLRPDIPNTGIIDYNWRGLLEPEYMDKHDLNIAPTPGLNERALNKFRTIRVVESFPDLKQETYDVRELPDKFMVYEKFGEEMRAMTRDNITLEDIAPSNDCFSENFAEFITGLVSDKNQPIIEAHEASLRRERFMEHEDRFVNNCARNEGNRHAFADGVLQTIPMRDGIDAISLLCASELIQKNLETTVQKYYIRRASYKDNIRSAINRLRYRVLMSDIDMDLRGKVA